MIDISTAGRDFQDEILNLIRASQDAVVEALQAWTTTVQSVTPSLPKVNLPYADRLPKPETLVNGAYDFAEQLLSAQRKFANDVLDIAAPLTGSADQS
jgi:phosphoglycolate phosphatase-like HAD superfamily hydrolase